MTVTMATGTTVTMRGEGIGNVLKSVYHRVAPLVRRRLNVKYIKNQAKQFGQDTIEELSQGTALRKALKRSLVKRGRKILKGKGKKKVLKRKVKKKVLKGKGKKKILQRKTKKSKCIKKVKKKTKIIKRKNELFI
jgi:hypothetical protein